MKTKKITFQNYEFKNRQKHFFRRLDSCKTENANSIENTECFLTYQKNIWGNQVNYNNEADWISMIEDKNIHTGVM